GKCHPVPGSRPARGHVAVTGALHRWPQACCRNQDVPEVFIDVQAEPKALQNFPEGVPELRLPQALPWGARRLLFLAVAAAAAVLANSAVFWHSPDLIKFGAFLSISLISAGARVRIPRVSEPLPLSYLFVLLG